MRINDDIQDMIAGLAHLGAVYLRISEKVNTFYQENPLLWMEAGSLSKSRGENMGCQDLGEFIEAMISRSKENPPARHEILFLKRYARKYDDPVLAMETVKEFLGKDRLERIDMIDKLKEQLRLFPDPTLGLSEICSQLEKMQPLSCLEQERSQSMRCLKMGGETSLIQLQCSLPTRECTGFSKRTGFPFSSESSRLAGNITFSSGAAQRSFGSTSGRKAIQISTPVPLCLTRH